MPRLFSSQRLTAVIAATLATGAVAIVPASAETRIETVLGTVTKSDPIRTSYIRKTPSDLRFCSRVHRALAARPLSMRCSSVTASSASLSLYRR